MANKSESELRKELQAAINARVKPLLGDIVGRIGEVMAESFFIGFEEGLKAKYQEYEIIVEDDDKGVHPAS